MASEIKVDTISEKTSAGGVTIDGLLIKDGGISGDVSLIGTTPTFTIGDAGAEDAALVFDGNAQDYYIALDDSADDLVIGKGSTVGTTPAISIDSDLKVNIPVTTASTSASTGSLITGGGMGVGADLYVGDDTYLITDSAVLGFGADKDTTLTHTDGTGLTLNSTNKLTFGDVASYINQSSDGVLTIAGEATIDLNASTAVLVSNDLKLDSDSSVLGFGADNDTTLTHTDGTGLTLNSTNKLCFNDSSQFIQGSSNAILSLGATDEIDLTATAVDLNGTLNVSGVATFQATPVFPDGSLAVADLDIDGATDIGAAVVDADLFIVDDGAGGTNRKVTASRIKTYAGSAAGSEYFEALVGGSNQTITHNTATKVSFDTEELDSGTVYDKDTNYRFTVASAGVYLIGYDINFNSDAANKIDNCYVYPKLNGSTFNLGSYNETAHGFRAQDNPISQISMSSTFIYDFDASDYVEIFVNVGHTDGGSNTFTIGREYTNWWAIRID